MGKNLKSLFLGIFLFAFIGLGINFLDANRAQAPKLATAQIAQVVLQPTLRSGIHQPDINAKAGIAIFLDDGGQEQILFEKNSRTPLSIASLTKLMTALVIAENYSLDQTIEITSEAAGKPGNGSGQLRIGDEFLMVDLFKTMLIESNNSAAMALAQVQGIDAFVALMNQRARDLNLESMYFVNPTGLDAQNNISGNASNAYDLAKLAADILQKKPYIFEISLLQEFDLRDVDGVFSHTAENTNTLLDKVPSLMGGKTGETPKSGGCLLLIMQAPNGKGYIVSILLDSPDRFNEMEKLIHWTNDAYQW